MIKIKLQKNNFLIFISIILILTQCNQYQKKSMDNENIKDIERSIREEKKLYETNLDSILGVCQFVSKTDFFHREKTDYQINAKWKQYIIKKLEIPEKYKQKDIISLIKLFLCKDYNYINQIRQKITNSFLKNNNNLCFLSYSDLVDTIITLKTYYLDKNQHKDLIELKKESIYLLDFPTYILPLNSKVQLINTYKKKLGNEMFCFYLESELFSKSYFDINSKTKSNYDLSAFLSNWKDFKITFLYKIDKATFLKFINYLKTIKLLLKENQLTKKQLTDPRNNGGINNYYNFIEIINKDIIEHLTLSRFNELFKDIIDFQNKSCEIFFIKKLFCNDLNKIENYIINHKELLFFYDQKYKRSSLLLSILKKEYDIMELLLKHGANINHQNFNKITPLILAVNTKDIKAINILLKYKPNLLLKNCNNEIALDIAKRKALPEITKLLSNLY